VTTNPNSPKDRAARAGATQVRDGMIVGLGSGSTAALMVRHLADRIAAEGLSLIGVATSAATADLATSLNIPLRDLDEVPALDISLDGADEIDPQFRMIKGRGGALLREKIVACSSAHRVTMLTADKRVERLGERMPVPVEVSTFGLLHTERHIRSLGGRTTIRRTPGGDLVLTDGGNAVIDCEFPDLDDPALLDERLQCLAGVLDTGLFIGLCDTLIIGTVADVEIIQNGAPPRVQAPAAARA
jgi:ribose 5-phosphate isomerase A